MGARCARSSPTPASSGTGSRSALPFQNARSFLEVRREFGSFDAYLWPFAGGRPIRNRWRALAEIPPRTPESDALSQDLRRRGFKFVGSTICYAFMQAAGLVNDHTVDCFPWREIR